MSRLRTIKPGFFLDEELAECQPLGRLLFAGLWTIADREGRLEDRPKRIKVEVLPYDDCDVDALLWELAERGFVVRYEVRGARFITIPTWGKHQSPHIKEQASTIPAPDSPDASTVQAQLLPPSSCLVSCLGSCLGSGVLEESGTEEHCSPLVESTDDSTTVDEPLVGDLVSENDTDVSFDAFWSAYPNKQGKVPAERTWKRLSRADRSAAIEAATAMAYCVECGYRDRGLCPHGSTFLNQRRFDEWRDEDGELRAPPGYGPANGDGPNVYDRIEAVGRRIAAERGEEWHEHE
jgi:hypothetical protein